MANESKIVYNPSLSIKENARRNKCSEDGIRYYIRTRGIDRRYSEKMAIIETIRKHLKKHPNATKLGTAKATKLGTNTVRKYWGIARSNESIEQNPKKIQQREAIRIEQEKRRVEFLDSITIEYIKDYIAKRESATLWEARPPVTEKIS